MEMNETGKGEARLEKGYFQAFNPATGEPIAKPFRATTADELDKVVFLASAAFPKYARTSGSQRAFFLEQIGEEILSLGDSLIQKCVEETGLPAPRIIGERARTINQLRLFADLVRDGSWVNARIDTPKPDRVPQPRPDVRQMQKPIGPVGVFEASNFPLAFSTAGGDTASALAAGCPVIAKSHSSHPGTSELVASAIYKAIQRSGMPGHIFSLIHGPGNEVGVKLVNHPLIKAIGFTGSFSGGKTLFDLANRRPEPIPVYAEMGSINPVFVLPDAVKQNSDSIASALAASIVLGVGQFCTKPGMIIMEDSIDALMFRNKLKEKLAAASGGTMLSPRIHKSYAEGVERFLGITGVRKIAQGISGTSQCQGIPYLLETSFQSFVNHEGLSEEVFGPCSLLVIADRMSEVLEIAANLNGQLTVTIHGNRTDFDRYGELIHILETKAGRLVMNGVPTGVDVGHSMVHGGPFPATSDARSTSVGTMAIYRFTRPVCYQDFAEEQLPDELKNSNPLSISRMVDGRFTNATVCRDSV